MAELDLQELRQATQVDQGLVPQGLRPVAPLDQGLVPQGLRLVAPLDQGLAHQILRAHQERAIISVGMRQLALEVQALLPAPMKARVITQALRQQDLHPQLPDLTNLIC